MRGIFFKYKSVKNKLHNLKIFIVATCMTFAGILCTTKTEAQAVNVQDSLALLDIYNSTNGPGWTNKTGWTTGPVATWYGVTLMNGRVDDLNLDGNNLVGTLPASIGNLTAIEYFEMGDNKLSGPIPTTVGNLTILRSLYWVNNLFTGTIPASLGSIPTLSDIYLQQNQLTGAIPAAIGNATSLVNLNLSYNQLTGPIPTSFSNLTNLYQLILSHNQLTGTIPSNLGNLLNTSIIDLSVNQLTGPIPASMTNLVSIQTLVLDSNKFDFTGMGELVTAVPITVYAPQDTLLPIHLFMNGLAVSAGGKLIQEFFTWYDNGVVDKTVQNDSTYVPTNPASCGPFTVQVGNAACQNLTLYSQPYSVKVVDSISITASETNICAGTQVTFQLTTLKQSKLSTFQWQVNGVNVGATGFGYVTSTLANNDVVTCVLTSGATCANPKTYTSNPITMTVRQHILPSFTQINPICQYSTPPAFSLISNEGIPGTWHPATINTSVPGTSGYIFIPTDSMCYRYDTMNITITPQAVPTFNPIGPYCQNSVPVGLPVSSIEGITGTWQPATINTTLLGNTHYVFTPGAGQCAKLDTVDINIQVQVIPTFDAIGPYCQNSVAPGLPLLSKEGITGAWSPAVINTLSPGIFQYIFTPAGAGQCSKSDTVNITITAQVKPHFDGVGPLCQNSVAPTLPASSIEGISGTWNPSVINTTNTGTYNYIFTPNAGQCAQADTITVIITQTVPATFDPIGPLCQFSVPPVLLPNSKETIAGIWMPGVISTTSPGTFQYIFFPYNGQCSGPDTIHIVINPLLTPSFDPIGPFCQNATPTALPASSKEGITGTWSPGAISTTTVGTFNYIFTPTAGQCAKSDTIQISVTAQITPTFDPIGPFCQNATPTVLPATSKEGIAGTWNPAVINTAMVGAGNYIFTPTGGACYTPATLSITISTQVTPTFDAIGPLCQNATAPALPATSKEGVAGTWNPAIINTATIGVGNYIFTPTVVGACYITATISITISAQVTPTFDAIGPLCQNATAPTLPATSKEGIAGTWNPAVINTATAGVSNYIFTPTAAGACSTPATLSITITTQVAPTFNPIGPLCQNATAPTLPASSKEGIAGTWNPAVISTAIIGTANYIFTPAVGGACSTPATLSITISTQVAPTFDAIGPLCQDAAAPTLPSTSKEGIAGTWNPAVISTATIGTANYIFTPAAGGACSTPATVSVTISTQVAPTFDAIGPLCQNATAPSLPATSKEGVAGAWNPATINTSTVGATNYVFTPTAAGSCSTPATLSVTISTQVAPTFDAVGPLCQNATAPTLPSNSKEGIAGTWNPATINTSTVGATNYVFTPTAAGSCSTPATLSVTISTQVAPTFDAIGPLCQNATAPSLPATSKEGVAGTWNPATINTSTVGTTNYVFTPTAAGACSTPATLSVTISTQVAPTFDAIGPLCQNTTPPVLPATSKEGIAGTWNPTVINTATLGTGNYIFTPAAGGTCNAPATLGITITTQVTPTFTAIASVCLNATAPSLPATSKEGVAGNWNPATVNTAVVGSTDYVFTPSGNQCAASGKLTIVVNPLPVVNAGPDKTINNGETVTLAPVIAGVTAGDIASYLWSPPDGLSNPAIASPVASPAVTTTYKLEVNSRAGCDGSGTVTINVIKTNLPPIHVPNAFSPNGDGINDTWVIENISYYPGATVDLFNRYGQRLLHSEGYGKAWDGTYNGSPVPVATYYYVLDPKNNLPKMTGSVTVFR